MAVGGRCQVKNMFFMLYSLKHGKSIPTDRPAIFLIGCAQAPLGVRAALYCAYGAADLRSRTAVCAHRHAAACWLLLTILFALDTAAVLLLPDATAWRRCDPRRRGVAPVLFPPLVPCLQRALCGRAGTPRARRTHLSPCRRRKRTGHTPAAGSSAHGRTSRTFAGTGSSLAQRPTTRTHTGHPYMQQGTGEHRVAEAVYDLLSYFEPGGCREAPGYALIPRVNGDGGHAARRRAGTCSAETLSARDI